jgi:hypothetical protein
MGLLQDAAHILQRGAEGATHWCTRCQQYCGGTHVRTGDEIKCNCHDGDAPAPSATTDPDAQSPGEVTPPPPDSAGQPEPPATDPAAPGVPQS